MPPTPPAPKKKTPAHVTVDHILIGVKNPRFPSGQRDEDEARALAKELVEKLRAGTLDWKTTKNQYSEDPPPGGPYSLAGEGIPPEPGEHARNRMVKGFGDVAFSLEIGEIGLAEYDAKTSPFGFHVIKRVK